MEDLTQTISNLVGILLGVVGAIGVGFFIYGAYLYLTASGAPNQMERGKSAMMTAPRRHRAGPGRLRRRGAGDERGGQPRRGDRRRAAQAGHRHTRANDRRLGGREERRDR